MRRVRNVNGGGREAGHVRTNSENVFNAVVVVWNSGSRSRPLRSWISVPQVDDIQTRIERSGGRNAAVREGRARETRICGLEVVMVEAREQGVFNLGDRDESRVKKKDKTQIHSIYIFDPRSYFH